MKATVIKLGSIAIALFCWQVAEATLAQAGIDAVQDFDHWKKLCDLQLNASNYEEALPACEQALGLKPKEEELWTTHSEILLALAQYPEAIASADRALRLNDESYLAMSHKCYAYGALGQIEDALEQCDEAIEKKEEIHEDDSISPNPVLRYRGTLHEQMGNPELALHDYERMQLLDPADSLTLAYKCRVQITLEQYPLAVASCQQAIDGNGEWEPENESFAFYHKGLAHARSEQYEQAVQAYDLALNSDPENANIWLFEGQALQAQQQFTPALVSYTRAVEIDPTSSRALLGQCEVMNQLAQHETAAAACGQAIQGDGQWWAWGESQAWNQQGRALSGQGKHDEALAAVSRAVGMRPDYADAWSNQSVIYWYIGNLQQATSDKQGALDSYHQAIASVGEALIIHDTTPSANAYQAHANIGRYHQALAQLYRELASPMTADMHLTSALSAYNQALELASEDTETWVNRSAVLWRLGEYSSAYEAARRAVELNSNLAQAWQVQATAQTALQLYAEARISYEMLVERDPHNADAWAALGAVRLKIAEDFGREDAEQSAARGMAIMALRRALEINPNQPIAIDLLALLEDTPLSKSLSTGKVKAMEGLKPMAFAPLSQALAFRVVMQQERLTLNE